MTTPITNSVSSGIDSWSSDEGKGGIFVCGGIGSIIVNRACTIDVHHYNEFVCIPTSKAVYAVIEASDVFLDIKYAYQTPGVLGGITIVVNDKIVTSEDKLMGPSGWRLIPMYC
jgi:hypothetical protein